MSFYFRKYVFMILEKEWKGKGKRERDFDRASP